MEKLAENQRKLKYQRKLKLKKSFTKGKGEPLIKTEFTSIRSNSREKLQTLNESLIKATII